MIKKATWIVIACLLFVTFSVGSVLAASYYEGKVITIISGHKAGGGYDRMARLLAKNLPKFIPGKPTIIVQNMPGAASIIAGNHLFNAAKPDGLTIGSLDRGVLNAQMTKEEGVKFDLKKFAWVGSPAAEPRVFLVRADLPYKNFDDLLKAKEIHLGDIGLNNYIRVIPLILRDFAGLKANMVSYPAGTRDIVLALERKELDGSYLTYSSHKPYIERGLVRPLFRGRVFVEEIKSLPVDEDLMKDPKVKAMFRIFSAIDQLGRPYVAPPGTPADLLKILQEAFKKACADPQVKAEAEKVKMELDYVTAADCMETINFVLTQPEDIIKDFVKYSKM